MLNFSRGVPNSKWLTFGYSLGENDQNLFPKHDHGVWEISPNYIDLICPFLPTSIPSLSHPLIVHMARILSKPFEISIESYSWCFKDAKKIIFWKCANFSQSPPTPCVWWKYLNRLYISLWYLTTTCEAVFKPHYDKTIPLGALAPFLA